ncbi:MAG: hypothetical protein WAJ99_05340 [Candidatus Sulfotelmatobacter sp.]
MSIEGRQADGGAIATAQNPEQRRSERMTIAVGILAHDGIVVAADTQETVGSHKADESKILIANQGLEQDKAGAIALTGAGDAGYLDSLNQDLCAAFLKKKIWSPAALLTKSKNILKDFHNDHVVPYARFPEHDRPQVNLVMGAQFSNNYCLWTTEKSTLHVSRKYCAVGLGRAYAQVMLKRFWAPMNTVQATSLAAFVIFHVKNTVDGCGNQTQIVIIKDGFAKWVGQPNIDLLENAYENYATHENLMLHFILGLDLRQTDLKNEMLVFCSRLQQDRKHIHDAQEFTMTSYHAGRPELDQPEMVRRPKK